MGMEPALKGSSYSFLDVLRLEISLGYCQIF